MAPNRTLKRPAPRLRTFLIIYNVIFWFAGLGILGLGIWLYLTMGDLQIAIAQADYELPVYLMIGSGSAVVVVGIIGCLAIFGANRCFLAFYGACVLILCVLDITACIKIFFIYDDVTRFGELGLTLNKNLIWHGLNNTCLMRSMTEYKLNVTIRYKYLRDSDVTSGTDHLQQQYKCCGINGYKDWFDPRFNYRAPVLTSQGFQPYPKSCCLETNKCDLKLNSTDTTLIFDKGCLQPVTEYLDFILPIVGWSTTAFSAAMIIGGTMVCCYRVALK